MQDLGTQQPNIVKFDAENHQASPYTNGAVMANVSAEHDATVLAIDKSAAMIGVKAQKASVFSMPKDTPPELLRALNQLSFYELSEKSLAHCNAGLPGNVNVYGNTAQNINVTQIVITPAGSNKKIPPFLPLKINQFIGRESDLKKLLAHFNVFEETPKFLVIVGMPGVGKTQLAIKYALQNVEEQRCSFVAYVDGDKIESDFLALADHLDIPTNIPTSDRINKAIRTISLMDKWLLIIDNVVNYLSIETYLPKGKGHILIASCNEAGWDKHSSLPLSSFTFEDALEFISTILNKNKQNAEFVDHAKRLYTVLGGLPLALRQACAFIGSQMTILEYVELFDTRRRELWEEEQAPIDHKKTVKLTFEFILREIRKTKNANLVLSFLDHIAYLSNHISFSVLKLIIKDKLSLRVILNELKKYSLIHEEQDGIVIHQLIQLVIIDGHSTHEQIKILQHLILHLHTLTPDRSDLSVVGIRSRLELVPHFEKIKANDKLLSIDNVIRCNFLSDFATTLYRVSRYKESLDFETQVSQIQSQLNAAPDIFAISTKNIAECYFRLGNLSKAEEFFLKAQRLLESSDGQSTYITMAYVFNGLGVVYSMQGNALKAKEFTTKAVAIRETYCPNSSDLATSYNNLARDNSDLGEIDVAMEYFRKARVIWETLDDTHLNIALVLYNQGLLYLELDSLIEAFTDLKKGLDIARKVYANDSPYVAKIMNAIGQGCYKAGRFDLAHKYCGEALKIIQKYHDEHHIDVLKIKFDYHKIDVIIDDGKSAIEKLVNITQKFDSKFSKNHVVYVSMIYELGMIFLQKNDHVQALKYFQNSIELLESLKKYPIYIMINVKLQIAAIYEKNRDNLNTLKMYQECKSLLNVNSQKMLLVLEQRIEIKIQTLISSRDNTL